MSPAPDDGACTVQRWASSGLMDLTGPAGGAPLVPEAPVLERLAAMLAEAASLAAPTAAHHRRSPATPELAMAVAGRAAERGWHRSGRTSANGTCRLLPTPDGWIAPNLARDEDVAAVPALTGVARPGDPWVALADAARSDPAELVERAALLGVPVGVLPVQRARPSAPPWSTTRLVPPATAGAGERPPLVVDLSALWAGPLCARVLADLGFDVARVESTARPDRTREVTPRWWRWLRAGQAAHRVDLGDRRGRAELRRLLEDADVVIEASRPRALRQLGLDPEDLDLRDGVTWLSITGYGRRAGDPGPVAFGDDAAVAGGLVAWADDGPVFCGDAIADPVTGITAALAVLRERAAGGGVLVDLAMRDAATAVAVPADADREDAAVRAAPDSGWIVECRHGTVPVRLPGTPAHGRAVPAA